MGRGEALGEAIPVEGDKICYLPAFQVDHRNEVVSFDLESPGVSPWHLNLSPMGEFIHVQALSFLDKQPDFISLLLNKSSI
jgi:hypothetical protein